MKTGVAQATARRAKRPTVIPFQTTSSGRKSSMSTRTRAKLWARSYGELLTKCATLNQKLNSMRKTISRTSSDASPKSATSRSPSSDVSESSAP